MFSEIIQRLRSLFSFSTSRTENKQLKRRADQPPNYSGLTKYRKVNNYFPIIIDKPIEGNCYGYEMGEQNKEIGIRRKYILPSITSKQLPKNSFSDFEFSDDEDDIVIPHRNRLQQNDHQDSSRSYSIGIIRNKRPVSNEDNSTRNPIIYNTPIQIELKKSNPPPLRDVKTASTCDPLTMYTPTRSTPTVANNITSNDDDIEYISTTLDSRNATKKCLQQSQQGDFSGNDDLYNNIIKKHQSPVANKSQQKSLITKFNYFGNRQEYLKLLEKIVPNNHPVDEVLISKFNINITRRDIKTLLGQNWLNDEVINFYMNLLMERSKERHLDGLPKVYAMNTSFIPRLQKSGHAGVRRWTRKIDIFEYDIIPVPVHVGQNHWCMAIIHLKNKSIKYYDSMGTPNPKIIKLLEQYLQDEAFDKKKIRYRTSKFVKESVKNIPRQMNDSDCGVFSCMFAEYITRNKPIKFTQKHMEHFRQKMVLEICRGKLLL